VRLARIAGWLVVTAISAFTGAIPAARGDGDPASDVLLVQNAFYPYSLSVSKDMRTALQTTLAHARSDGFPVKVALIGGPIDLGAIPQIFGHPENYARFLDMEISYNVVPRLVVVMPDGIGVAGMRVPAELASVRVDRSGGGDALARAGIQSIVLLARLAGHPIPLTLPTTGASSGPPATVAVGAGVAVLVLAAAALRLALRRRKRSADSTIAHESS
jgi:LPXTG-motif cell wall-anchored protein